MDRFVSYVDISKTGLNVAFIKVDIDTGDNEEKQDIKEYEDTDEGDYKYISNVKANHVYFSLDQWGLLINERTNSDWGFNLEDLFKTKEEARKNFYSKLEGVSNFKQATFKLLFETNRPEFFKLGGL